MVRYPTAYSATIAVAVAAVMAALQLGWLSLPAGLLYFLLSRYSLGLMAGQSREDDPYKKVAEQIAAAGMLIFLLLIISTGVVAGLLVFLVFAQLALNFQSFEKTQFYLGLLLSFTLICFSASESRDGSFVLYFIPYSLFLCATLFGLNIEKLHLSAAMWLKNSLLLLSVTFLVYMLMPRFPALLLGSTPGSDYYYHNDNWLEKAEQKVTETESRKPTTQRDSTSATDGDFQQALDNLKGALEEATQQQGAEGESDETAQQGSTDTEYDMGIDNSPRLNHEIVMQVRSDMPLYLTTQILDHFDGLSWSQSLSEKTYIEKQQKQFIRAVLPLKDEDSVHVRYEVELVEDLPQAIPLAWEPAALNFPATALKRDAYGSFSVPDKLQQGTAYSAAMQAKWHNQRLLYPQQETELEAYLALPDALDSRITALTNEVTQAGDDNWDKARLLEQHLRENYSYTLDTVIPSQGVTPLAEFLFETRYGHCEYFASAMAVMLRTQGIPSRVVNGFAATDQNPLTGFIEVRGTDAHAWVEAYHEGLGWVPYEPTAYYELPQQEEDLFTYEKVNEYVDRQLEILEQQEKELSFKEMVLKSWQALVSLVAILALSIKWLLMTYGALMAACIVAVVLLWMLFEHVKPELQAWWLKRQVKRYKPVGNVQDYTFYIQAVHKSLYLKNKPSQFSTIENFVALLAEYNSCGSDDFLTAFNQQAYSDEAGTVDTDQLNWLKETFDNIWQSPLKAN